MTRCGDRRCTVPSHQAHPIPPLPSNVQRGPFFNDGTPIFPVRTDPGYDQPGPPRRSDLSWATVVQAFVVFVAIVLFCVLASLVEVGS